MTEFNRPKLPESLKTNGSAENPWWANAVVYQIYPRSFQDTNGDGFGDLRGVIQRLPYLADLGIDVIWLSPVYKSPQDDNGYDISDYEAIDPMFGTMEDMDMLISRAHKLGIKIIMDLVVNHTSDEHEWFRASKDKDDPHSDWYWWRPAKPGFEPGTPGAEPNRWGSYFGGSAWQYDSERGEYFLHQFSPKQPDLNWENPQVRQAVFDMMNRWLDRGIDGFRMDVITLISKHLADGDIPSEETTGEPGPDGYCSLWDFCSDGPRLDEFLSQMRREVFEGRDGFLTVGEAPGMSAQRGAHITDPASGELDMLFLFDHMGIDQEGPAGKWSVKPWKLGDLKRVWKSYQTSVAQKGWASLFVDNHDQPRVVSRWGDDSSEKMRVLSAKAFGLFAHMHRGTPYIYQGEELGMTNANFTDLSQYRDLESVNMYHQLVEQAHVLSSDEMMNALRAMSRDNARTPRQWDDTRFAVFTAEYAPKEPWIEVNSNSEFINAQAQIDDPNSVYSFYKSLIALRHANPVVACGDFKAVAEDDEKVYAFVRSLPPEQVSAAVAASSGSSGSVSDDTAVVSSDSSILNGSILPDSVVPGLVADGSVANGSAADSGSLRDLLVVINMSSSSARLPDEVCGLIGDGVDGDSVLLTNYDPDNTSASILLGKLSPWEAFVYAL